MLANEDDIIVCYKAGLKKTNIIKHYGISKMRLNRILDGIEAPKKPTSYNDNMRATDLMEHICNFPKSYGLARVMRFAQLTGLDPNKIFENRRVKHENINLTEDIISLINAGVKKTIISALDWDGSGAGLDISGMRKILKRHKVEIKTDFRTKIKMTEEQKDILRKLYEKHHIAATFSNAVKIIHYVNEFLTYLDPNDFIKILLETNQEIDQEKFSENLQFFAIGLALHEFENYNKIYAVINKKDGVKNMSVKNKLNQSEIIDTLKKYKNEHEKDLGLIDLGIFGSVARQEIKPDSDIDVVIKLKTPDLFVMSGIKLDLEEIFGMPVDIIRYRENMNSFLKKRIDKEAIYV